MVRLGNKTDEEIQKFFGTMSDFMMTLCLLRMILLALLTKDSTKRKEILAKFLDFKSLTKCIRLAKV